MSSVRSKSCAKNHFSSQQSSETETVCLVFAVTQPSQSCFMSFSASCGEENAEIQVSRDCEELWVTLEPISIRANPLICCRRLDVTFALVTAMFLNAFLEVEIYRQRTTWLCKAINSIERLAVPSRCCQRWQNVKHHTNWIFLSSNPTRV